MGLVFNSVDIEESVISFLTTVSLYSADIKVSPGQNKKINLNTSVITHYDFFLTYSVMWVLINNTFFFIELFLDLFFQSNGVLWTKYNYFEAYYIPNLKEV